MATVNGRDCGSDLLAKLVAEFNQLRLDVNAIVTLVNELKTDLSAHTHGGVTAGADSTSAGPTISAADAALNADEVQIWR